MRIVPKYAQINITTNNAAAKKTPAQAQTLRIKNEIKYLYKKKEQLYIFQTSNTGSDPESH
jgi:hypothetical protein